MLDNLSQGRMHLGFGRGIMAIEHTFWGHPADEAQRRYDETLAIVLQCLTSDTLTHDGEFFDFDAVPLELSPKQRPHPPFWYASRNPDFAAQPGSHFLSHGGPGLPKVLARYKEVFQEHQDRPNRLNPQVREPLLGSSRRIFVADTDAEADRVARQAWSIYQDNFARGGMSGPGPETRPNGTTVPLPPGGPGSAEARDFDRTLRVESALVGSPDTIREYVQRYADESGANYFVGPSVGGILVLAVRQCGVSSSQFGNLAGYGSTAWPARDGS